MNTTCTCGSPACKIREARGLTPFCKIEPIISVLYNEHVVARNEHVRESRRGLAGYGYSGGIVGF